MPASAPPHSQAHDAAAAHAAYAQFNPALAAAYSAAMASLNDGMPGATGGAAGAASAAAGPSSGGAAPAPAPAAAAAAGGADAAGMLFGMQQPMGFPIVALVPVGMVRALVSQVDCLPSGKLQCRAGCSPVWHISEVHGSADGRPCTLAHIAHMYYHSLLRHGSAGESVHVGNGPKNVTPRSLAQMSPYGMLPGFPQQGLFPQQQDAQQPQQPPPQPQQPGGAAAQQPAFVFGAPQNQQPQQQPGQPAGQPQPQPQQPQFGAAAFPGPGFPGAVLAGGFPFGQPPAPFGPPPYGPPPGFYGPYGPPGFPPPAFPYPGPPPAPGHQQHPVPDGERT